MDGPATLFNGNFTQNTMAPHNVTSGSAVTLPASGSTYQNFIPIGNLPYLTEDFWTVGRLVYMRHTFTTTTGATPGALFVGLLYGSGANGAGQLVCSTGLNWVASLTGVLNTVELWCRCRATGTTGSLLGYGTLFAGGAGLLPIPWNTVGGVTIDTTQEGYLHPQYYCSGTTVQTLQHHDFFFKVMN